MQRLIIEPRANWQDTVSEQGLIYHTPKGVRYWDESACYQFDARQVDQLESATNQLHGMCLEAVQNVIDGKRFAQLGIPEFAVPAILQAWEDEPPSIYGRFDFSYDGKTPPKLLEYNADTPTSLLEAAVIQWYWQQDVKPQADQFNSIHERLIAKWKELKAYVSTQCLYFAHAEAVDLQNDEDLMTVAYLRDTAEQAGIRTSGLFMKEIGWRAERAFFADVDGNKIDSIFKLYPWEWLVHEEFGAHALQIAGQMQWIEPLWKMVLSNKGILAILWEMYPGHPNLLEAHLDDPKTLREFVKKPKMSREGANVTLHSENENAATEGDYGEEGYVYQAVAPLPDFAGNRPVIGSWVIDGESAGIGIRESDGPITDNLSRFVPHFFG